MKFYLYFNLTLYTQAHTHTHLPRVGLSPQAASCAWNDTTVAQTGRSLFYCWMIIELCSSFSLNFWNIGFYPTWLFTEGMEKFIQQMQLIVLKLKWLSCGLLPSEPAICIRLHCISISYSIFLSLSLYFFLSLSHTCTHSHFPVWISLVSI